MRDFNYVKQLQWIVLRIFSRTFNCVCCVFIHIFFFNKLFARNTIIIRNSSFFSIFRSVRFKMETIYKVNGKKGEKKKSRIIINSNFLFSCFSFSTCTHIQTIWMVQDPCWKMQNEAWNWANISLCIFQFLVKWYSGCHIRTNNGKDTYIHK